MTDADWLKAVLGAVVVIMVAPWVVWISRSASGALSRGEHRELCEEREARIACDLEEIKTMIKDNNKDAVDSRHNLGNRITELALRIATLPGHRDEDGPPERQRR